MSILSVFSGYRRRSRERGAAIVEFAVVCPLLCAILFGIIEYGHLFLVQQTLTNAAREGCRMVVLQTATSPYAEASARVGQIMNAAGIDGDEYNIAIDDASTNGRIDIEISVDYDDVTLLGVLPNTFLGGTDTGEGRTLTGRCSMRKEGI